MSASDSDSTATRFRWVVGLFLAGVLVWVLFFDSHSLLRRYQWRQELETLTQENAELRTDIQRLRKKINRPLPDSVVERLAREEYGMKRPGETIYRIKPE